MTFAYRPRIFVCGIIHVTKIKIMYMLHKYGSIVKITLQLQKIKVHINIYCLNQNAQIYENIFRILTPFMFYVNIFLYGGVRSHIASRMLKFGRHKCLKLCSCLNIYLHSNLGKLLLIVLLYYHTYFPLCMMELPAQ